MNNSVNHALHDAVHAWIDENLEEAAEMKAGWARGEYATSSIKFLWLAERAFARALAERDPSEEIEELLEEYASFGEDFGDMPEVTPDVF